MEERCKCIIDSCKKIKSDNPIEIFNSIASKECVRIHGPEHHILDGAAILCAYYNVTKAIDLDECLIEMVNRGMKMPGAICGHWGVCGAVSSIGAALSIIDKTTPLSSDESWSKHMEYTSKALSQLAKVGGPRCCKRDAYLALLTAIDFINEYYHIHLKKTDITCIYSPYNQQCIKGRCPFYK